MAFDGTPHESISSGSIISSREHSSSDDLPQEDAQEQLAHRLAEETGLAAERVETAVAVAFNQAYQGPIPSPQIVERLNAIQPGLGTRMVEDHLQQRQHDRDVDLEQIALELAASRRADNTVRISGVSVGASFTLLFGLVACALYLAFHGHPELAGVFLAAPLVMVLGTLIPWRQGERPRGGLPRNDFPRAELPRVDLSHGPVKPPEAAGNR